MFGNCVLFLNIPLYAYLTCGSSGYVGGWYLLKNLMNADLLFCAFDVVSKHMVKILNIMHIVMVLLLLERILVLFSLLKNIAKTKIAS